MRMNLKRDFIKSWKLLISIFMMWMSGLTYFIYEIPIESELKVASADAIVILTGGSMRLEEGLDLFDKVQTKKVLISGVGKGFSTLDIEHLIKKSAKLKAEDVILGTIADSTYSNAIEADIFMTLRDFKSMILVTSNYHMLRTKIIFAKIMPEVEITFYPVCSDNFKKGSYFISWPSFKVATNEYNKLLAFYFTLFYNEAVKKSDLFFYPLYEFISDIMANKLAKK